MRRSQRIEIAFERWARGVIRWRWVAIVLPILFVGGLAAQLPRLQFENDPDKFLNPGDPAYVAYQEFKAQFGRDEVLVIALQPPEVFSLPFLELLRDLHRELERNVAYVDDVSSLINARSTRGRDQELVVEELFVRWPRTDDDVAALRERALANPLYRNLLISAGGEMTTIVVRSQVYAQEVAADEALEGFGEEVALTAGREGLTHEQFMQFMRDLETVVARYESPELRIDLAGSLLMGEEVNDAVKADMSRFAVVSILVISGFLLVLFRRVSGVVLPVAIVVLSSLSIMGLMAITAVPLSVVTQVLPSFVMIVGVCDAVHILTLVYQRLDAGESREDAIVQAMKHSGLAVAMTSITTAGGLLSFTSAELAPVVALGIFAPIGVIFAFLFTVTFLPALLVVLPLRPRDARRRNRGVDALESVVVGLGDIGARHPVAVLTVTGAVLCLALVSALDLRRSFDPLAWFPEEDPYAVSARYVDEMLQGTNAVEIVIDTGGENHLHEPDVLNRLEALSSHLLSYENEDFYVGTSLSLVDIVKEIHQALNENRSDAYLIPQERPVVAQELLLFENAGSQDLEDVTDSRFQLARLSLRVPQVDAVLYEELMLEIERAFSDVFGDSAQAHTTGSMALMARATGAITTSLATSYIIALIVIIPLMMLLLGSAKQGLVSMIPNLAPVIVAVGLMGTLDIPVEVTTLLVGSMLLGLAVDDTIHFMHKFNIYYAESQDVRQAVRETLRTTGMALLFTSLVLSAGFFVFTLAYMQTTISFGLLMGVAILVAFLADVLVAPALMAIVLRRSASLPSGA